MNGTTPLDAQATYDPLVIAAALAAIRDNRRGGISRRNEPGVLYTFFHFTGRECIFHYGLQVVVERELGEELVECVLPGSNGQINLVQRSRALALGLSQ